MRASFAAIVVAQQAREARGGAQFPGFRAHLLGKGGRFAEVGFGRSAISLCVANYWIFDTNQQFATHRFSLVRYGRKERHISAQSFCFLQNVAKCMDWLAEASEFEPAERDEFEPSVPIVQSLG